jgi:AcrR family transcriptional regulator
VSTKVTKAKGRGRAGQAAATREQLIAVAREMFAERGYYDTSTPDIVVRSGLTRGALYHHFADKKDLFLAVMLSVQEDVRPSATPASGEEAADPWENFKRRIDAFLETTSRRPDIQRILLVDGPAVLGWRHWREIQSAYGLGLIETALRQAMDANSLPPGPTTPLAHLILAAVDEACMLIATAKSPERARKEVSAALVAMLDGIVRRRA